MPLVEGSRPGELWVADSHFCTRSAAGLAGHGASFIVREHGRHPKVGERASGVRRRAVTRAGCAKCHHFAAGALRGQARACTAWRCIEIELDEPTESGSKVLRLWSNLPATVEAPTIATLYRKRWRIEGMFGRLESVLPSEIRPWGTRVQHCWASRWRCWPTTSWRCCRRWSSRRTGRPCRLGSPPFHLAQHVREGFGACWWRCRHGSGAGRPSPRPSIPGAAAAGAGNAAACREARHGQARTRSRPPKGWVDGRTARSHFSTARVLRLLGGRNPKGMASPQPAAASDRATWCSTISDAAALRLQPIWRAPLVRMRAANCRRGRAVQVPAAR